MGCSMGSAAAKPPAKQDNNKDQNDPQQKEEAPPPPSKLIDKYAFGDMLGQGTFGIVYACTKRDDNQECAVKMVDRIETPEEKVTHECNMMKRMNHPNIIRCFDIVYEKCFVCIVMERLHGGDLIGAMQAHWQSKGKIPITVTSGVLRQMALSLHHLHKQEIVHRDVKGDNYLCDRPKVEDPQIRVVLIDFGTVVDCKGDTRLREKCGTKLFWAPEFYSRNYAIPVDVWAMGVVFYGLLNGRFPFKDEAEVRNKVVKVSDSVPKECKILLQRCLAKAEDTRIQTAQVIKHPFVKKPGDDDEGEEDAQPNNQKAVPKAKEKPSAATGPEHAKQTAVEKKPVVLRGDVDEPEEENEDPEGLRLSIATEAALVRETANAGILERRQELVERFHDAHAMWQKNTTTGTGSVDSMGFRRSYKQYTIANMHYCQERFVVKAPRGQGTFSYEWWDAQKLKTNLDASIFDGKVGSVVKETDVGKKESMEEFDHMLKDHDIDTAKFGVGKAKTLAELFNEVQIGSAVMMLDATKHKKIVRTVNIVCLRIFSGEQKGAKVLIEYKEKYADGRERFINRLPATKKEPFENTRQTAERIVRENLASFGSLKAKFNWEGAEVFEEEEESPSYPGIRTIYRKQIIEGYLGKRESEAIQRQSLSSGKGNSNRNLVDASGNFNTNAELEKRSKNNITKFCKWYTEKEVQNLGIKYRAPPEGQEVSALVHAPVGMDVDELTAKLKAENIDISKFGKGTHKSIADLSAELLRGQCVLAHDDKGLVRIVDIVIAQICRRDGKTLVEVSHMKPDGKQEMLNRLPGAKRRPDENQYLTTKRVLRRTAKIDEDHIEVNPSGVSFIEEEKTSSAFASLRTIYRRRIVPAMMTAKLEDAADYDAVGIYQGTSNRSINSGY